MNADELVEDLRWAVVLVFLAIGSADPLVQRFWEGCYRIGWWIRRSADRARGAFVDGVTFIGDFYYRVAEWTVIRYKRFRRK
jgi:hypothetical protein